MRNDLLREGGPLGIRRTGRDRFEASVPLPKDAAGRLARQCPDSACAPGYFKVRAGIGQSGPEYTTAYCPYCRHSAASNEFATAEQMRYARDHLMNEARSGVDRMVRDTFRLGRSGRRTIGGGLLSIKLSYKPSHRMPVRRPREEPLRRDVVCPACGLDQSVYGLATWCAGCGEDIVLAHVAAEFEVVRKMLGDVERRHEQLGVRIATKDLENALEDVVSIFEAVVRILVRRAMKLSGTDADAIDKALQGFGSGFQSVTRTTAFLKNRLGWEPIPGLPAAEAEQLTRIFEKRHPITHNFGVVDRKYLARVVSRGREGREVIVTSTEILEAIALCEGAFAAIAAQSKY